MSPATGYAILALATLSATGRPMTVRELADYADLPRAYLARIMGTLAKQGLVIAQRGAAGGVRLADPPDTITLLDVVRAVDPTIDQQACLVGFTSCPGGDTCPTSRACRALHELRLRELEAVTIDDFAKADARFAEDRTTAN